MNALKRATHGLGVRYLTPPGPWGKGSDAVKEERLDRRVKYTRMALRESLLEILREKPLSKITSVELCRRADINRNTFYAHYKDPADLLSSIEGELYAEFKRSLDHSLKFESIPTLIIEVCGLILRNLSLCEILFSERGDRHFLDEVIYLSHDRSIAEWRKMTGLQDTEQLEMLYAFFMNGSLAIIQRWIENGVKESPEEIAHLIDKLSSKGLRAFSR